MEITWQVYRQGTTLVVIAGERIGPCDRHPDGYVRQFGCEAQALAYINPTPLDPRVERAQRDANASQIEADEFRNSFREED